MFTLIIGGSASGKSEYAEQWTLSLGENRIYIATMRPWDEECLERIAKHRRARAGRGFATMECYSALESLTLPPESNVLLECMSNLLANEMYDSEGKGAMAVLRGIEHLQAQCLHLTVVTNEVFSGGDGYEAETLHYMAELAWLNRELARRADRVVEVLCTCPNVLKADK